MPGIFFNKTLLATQSTATQTLVDATGMSFILGASAKAFINFFLMFTVGATGGFRFRFDASAAVSAYNLGWMAIDGVTGTANVESAVIAVEADITNAWAVAGSFIFTGSLYVSNSTAANTIKLQFAQNATDATAIQLIAGSNMAITIL